jgi:predicted nucleic acid-binding protein
MILVDSNVWSEAFRPKPDRRVEAWAEQNTDRLWLATVVIGELLSGAHLLPEGIRKQRFLEGYEALISAYSDRILAFDLEAARRYGSVLSQQERAGRNPGTADTQIAAMALAKGMKLATRNVRHFEGLGLELVDPWTA